ncbi:MAG: serine/threonine-protein kinase [Candidatus Xenobia bacterium]
MSGSVRTYHLVIHTDPPGAVVTEEVPIHAYLGLSGRPMSVQAAAGSAYVRVRIERDGCKADVERLPVGAWEQSPRARYDYPESGALVLQCTHPSALWFALPVVLLAIVAALLRRTQRTLERARRLDSLVRGDRDADPRLRQKLGDYLLLERLGQGGTGVVYKAVHGDTLDDAVAVKVMRRTDPDAFSSEVNACRQLSHPGIVHIIDWNVEPVPYIVMELMTGGTLRERMPMPAAAALSLMQHVFEAVEYAHEHQITHRDLKPENVLLTPDGMPRVADFGVAGMGTPGYAPPDGGEPDRYALGVMLYEMLTGAKPFEGPALVPDLDALVRGLMARQISLQEAITRLNRAARPSSG